MISSEAVPYAKTGGLADVVPALSRELTGRGHEVKVILPYYGSIPSSGIEPLPWSIELRNDALHTLCRVSAAVNEGVEYLFIQHPVFTERSGLYGNTGSIAYPDNMYRFTILNYAVFEICRRLNWYPDIFHSHDWQAALVPVLLKQAAKDPSSPFSAAASMITIHNLGYQGKFSKHDIHLSGIDSSSLVFADAQGGKTDLSVNFLASALTYADSITTVSETYAEEIQHAELGEGLHRLLASRRQDVRGILNGVDYSEWNPEQDPFIPLQYSAEDQKNKRRLKMLLQQEMELPVDPNIPLIGAVSRLADQKGFRELCGGTPSALERIVHDFPLQIVIVGTGELAIEQALTEIAGRNPNLVVKIMFSNYLAHLVEAGSDFFLMPSRYEPCGLNQIYSLRYGTIPIVRRTGGLADTVQDFSDNYEQGTGIVFDLMAGEAVYQTMHRVMSLWNQPEHVKERIRSRCMHVRFLWESSATKYEQAYSDALKKRSSL